MRCDWIILEHLCKIATNNIEIEVYKLAKHHNFLYSTSLIVNTTITPKPMQLELINQGSVRI